MEILATRSPPQLQECLTVYKHSKSVGCGEGGRMAKYPLLLALPTGELSGSLCASELFPWDLSPPHPPLPVLSLPRVGARYDR